MVSPVIDATELTQIADMVADWRQFYSVEQREFMGAIGDTISRHMIEMVETEIFPGQTRPIDDTGNLAASIGWDMGQDRKGVTLQIGVNPQVRGASRPDLRRSEISAGPGMEPGSTAGLYWRDVEFGQYLQPDAPAQEFLGWRTEEVRERQPRGHKAPTEGQLPFAGQMDKSEINIHQERPTVRIRRRPVVRSYNASDTDWADLEDWAYRKFPDAAEKILGSLRNKMDQGIPTNPQPFFSQYAHVTRDGKVVGLSPTTISLMEREFAAFIENLSRYQRQIKATGQGRTYYALRRQGRFTPAQGRVPAGDVTQIPFRRGAFRDQPEFAQMEHYIDQEFNASPWAFGGTRNWPFFGMRPEYPWSRHRPDISTFQFNPFRIR